MTAHPRLPGHLAPGGLGDESARWPVTGSIVPYSTAYLTLREDTIEGPDGERHARAVVQPRGAVAVLALDEDDRLLLVQQYRHAVGRLMVELPAGIRDVDDEAAVETAARELAEEGDVVAGHWEPHLRTHASPGYSTEVIEVFRATDLHPVPAADRTRRVAEEAQLRQWWLPFDRAVEAVLDGRITNALAACGVLAEHARRYA